ncbi:type I polyketide synthase [Desulfonema ishimotonii]|uniref:Type I polyketide synthase n=1 Tax=Desulfonema ishimotonii TaxID=45657 RepID=A0A401FWQ0_9BACT|nr:beta-ketoacyl synthase N-terminal-like domain-containing protein [Desulfonema ishimotonii]GBC61395.1 type I polyketide synthase [Desulfonema ishimotonii]
MKQNTPIAVVGMSGIFPDAPDLNTFWNNIVNKKNAAAAVPPDRWIIPPDRMLSHTPEPDKALSGRACLVSRFDFDPDGFDLDPGLLKALDPLYHMVLHAGREAFSDCNTARLDKARIGVTLAAIALPTDAASRITREILGRAFAKRLFQGREGHGKPELTRNRCIAAKVTSLPGAILAKALGLGGGSFTLDAACASSIYAVKLACDALRTGRADAMLAGGVSRPECLYTQVGFSQLRALSPSGRCAPFDKTADGLVVGEGAGILVLKRLDDALAHGDTVYGVVEGIGLSNDMRGNLLAPDTGGQIRAMRSAYEMAGWSPSDVEHIECHGTGTPVGDATEISSLRTLWGESGWSEGQCAIGSVKSMVGHLLTGAGAASMIKTLLALKYKALPPSLNFTRAPENSPLHHSPFRVQTEPRDWPRRKKDVPRRAAVSAFGFGGINAHILFSEQLSVNSKQLTVNSGSSDLPTDNCSLVTDHCPIAIVGMEAVFGASIRSLREFQEAVLNGESVIGKRPENRWKGADEIVESALGSRGTWGGYLEDVSLYTGEFRIPPNEIPDILPQQLLMLKVAAGAMGDAGLPLREYRERMGVTIGMEFDPEATNFHLRWNLWNEVRKQKAAGEEGVQKLFFANRSEDADLEALRDQCGPPLTPPRVLGALGGIVASRIAREFRFGGPSYVISDDAASGIRALEIGVRALQQGEADTFLVGAIDLAGDVRNIVMNNSIRPYAASGKVSPFDRDADGTLPGEGAVALVLKPLDRAVADGDRIYATIRGIGSACGGGIDIPHPTPAAYQSSLKQALEDAQVSPASVSYIEAHGSGDPEQDQLEAESLHAVFRGTEGQAAVGSLRPLIGDTGAASGLASLVKASLCLYQEILPPLKNCITLKHPVWQEGRFHIPAFPQFWLRDRADGPRRACVCSMTWDGNCAHVVLEGVGQASGEKALPQVVRERKRPLGLKPAGLFAVEGDSPGELLERLDRLAGHFAGYDHLDTAARAWYAETGGLHPDKKYATTIVIKDRTQAGRWIAKAKQAISERAPKKVVGPSGISYFPEPLGPAGRIAFVFPGSGNHYVGMGRNVGVFWPEVLRQMDAETGHFKTQMVPECYMPQRTDWSPGWEEKAREKIISDPLYMIFGQVVHGGVMTNLVREFGIRPDTVIGYSLGESAGLFATGAWPERGEMLKRMRNTDLFTTELAGPCKAARRAWKIPDNEEIDWRVAVVNRPAATVRKVIAQWPFARLLIVNTPDECVIGGRKADAEAVIRALKCDAIFLEGVVTVHCDAALPVAAAYKSLHRFPTIPPEDIQYYSCALGRTYRLTDNNAAASILRQATNGFDFPATIDQAYEDGVRIFLEMGPQSSCTRMISRILRDKPHSAASVCARGEDDYLTLLKFLGILIAERVSVNMDRLYGEDSYPPALTEPEPEKIGKKVTVAIGAVSSEQLAVNSKPLPVNSYPSAAGNEPLPVRDEQVSANSVSPDADDDQPAGENGRLRFYEEPRSQQSAVSSEQLSVNSTPLRENGESLLLDSQQSTLSGEPLAAENEPLPVRDEQLAADSAPPSADGEQVVMRDVKTEEDKMPESRYSQPDADITDPYAEETGEFSGAQSDTVPEYAGLETVPMFSDLIRSATENIEATAEAHKQFLEFSDELTRNFGKAFALQNRLLSEQLTVNSEQLGQLPVNSEQLPVYDEGADPSAVSGQQFAGYDGSTEMAEGQPQNESQPEPLITDNCSLLTEQPQFPREMCMEFAIGSVEKVLGPMFAEVDTYPVRVRLPDEPLMLVDRIMEVNGEKGSMTSGSLVTEHDVFPNAWYLDGDRAPVCISVEAGQADLFLCSWLGIDLKVRGKRAYRLLDAKVRFHRGLPRPGDTIRYDIHIDKFIRQGEVYMFMFRFEGTINGEPLITMRDGCAGFFTKEEVQNSGGIILTDEYRHPEPGRKDFTELVPMSSPERYEDDAVEALRHGDLAGCFGPDFDGVQIAESLCLPSCQMRLMDRVLHLDPKGGRFGLGIVQAEADIHPDAWFLTCHFVDDMVMPGTLMYECCAHTLRVLLQRMGWVTDKPGTCYEPVIGTEAVLKCRGPVTPETQHVVYEVEIKEIGYNPEPYVIADALMYGDGERIVQFIGMSMKLTGVTREEIESFWANRRVQAAPPVPKREIYTREQLLAFCEGNPSDAFGEPYQIFDEGRKIARLPRPPYFFMDRITLTEPEPWALKAGGWIEAEYDLPGDEWYFRADRSGVMPFCILLEIALQPCGWLAAYAGSALRSETDLKFRNLGGKAVLCRNYRPENGTLTMRARMSSVSEAGGMIIENFDMQVLQDGEMIYDGDTYFGFFSAEALANQVGIPGAKETAYEPSPDEIARGRAFAFENEAPLSPHDPDLTPAPALALPSKALRMIDEIELYVPDGGPHGLGFVRGVKTVDVDEWFFQAHFYQDPVCPGSLGLESFIQLMKFAALDRWGHLADTHRFEMVTDAQHEWIYRGQIIQKNKRVEVDAVITKVEESPVPTIWASGYLKVDGLFIYQMENFGLRLVAV